MLKLRRRATRHFVTLIEIHVHLIRVSPGDICSYLLKKHFLKRTEHKNNFLSKAANHYGFLPELPSETLYNIMEITYSWYSL